MEMLSDDGWARPEVALGAARTGTGRPPVGLRRVVEGVIRRQRNGAKWRALPTGLGPWWRAAPLHIRPVQDGQVGPRPRASARCRAGRPRRGGHGRHERAGSPQGGRRKRVTLSQALGRSRGGFGTKALVATDAGGRAVLIAVLSGQASEVRAAPSLLDEGCRPGPVGRVVRGRGCSSDPWRAAIRAAGAEPCVPGQPAHPRAPPHNRSADARRHRVETLRARLKEHRAIASRYGKAAASLMEGLHLAACLNWLSDRAPGWKAIRPQPTLTSV